MRSLRAWAGLALLVSGAAACEMVSGLNDLQEVDDLGGADGSVDGTVDAPATADARKDSPAPDTFAPDVGLDAPIDFDGGADAPDVGIDAKPDVVDAGVDAPPVDCGVPNTIQNCSGCGLACDTTFSNGPSCNGTTCQYTSCKAGRQNCDTSAPDTNGCECATPGCCSGGTCNTTHSNGVGGFYYDCHATGTYNSTQATEACASFTLNAQQCTQINCGGGDQSICSTGSPSSCICWSYSGTTGGHVANAGVPGGDGGVNCICPSLASPSWN